MLNYPDGAANDPRAPWNQIEPDAEPCDCGEPKHEGAIYCPECEGEEAADEARTRHLERDYEFGG